MSIVHTPSITHLDPIVPCPNIRQSSGFHGWRGREWCGRRALRLLVGWLIVTILKIRWGNNRVGPRGRTKMASHRSAELMCCWIGRRSQKVNMKPLEGWMLRCNWEVKVDQGVALFSVSINKNVLGEPDVWLQGCCRNFEKVCRLTFSLSSYFFWPPLVSHIYSSWNRI